MRLSPSPLPLCELTQLDIRTKPLTAEDTSLDQAFHIVFGQLCPFNILARFSPNVESHTESSRCRSCSTWLSLCGSLSFPKGQKARRQSLVKVQGTHPKSWSHTETTCSNPTATSSWVQRQKCHSQTLSMRCPSHMHGCRKPTLWALLSGEIPFPDGGHRGHFPAAASRAGGDEHPPRG